MEAVGYYLFRIFTGVITLLPLRALYVLSDFLYLLLGWFPSYRKKIVETNLRNSFPEKSEKEIRKIRNRFYRHLADVFIESLKMSNMSWKELQERFTYSGVEEVDRVFEEKRDIIAVTAHYGNWELSLLVHENVKPKCYVIYKPMQNKHFERFINRNRTRFGLDITPMSMIIKEIINCRNAGINTLSLFIADQSPPVNQIKYWTKFLNQDTAVYTGAEKIAAKYDMALFFVTIRKKKRGYYDFNFELLFDHTAGITDHIITETHVRRLEEVIREKPEYWMWSHRRWKHKKPAANG